MVKVVLWITTVLAGLGTLAGLVLAYQFLFFGRDSSDKGWGVGLAVFALAQNGIAYAGFRLAAGGRTGLALGLAIAWGIVSLLFLLAFPVALSATGQ